MKASVVTLAVVGLATAQNFGAEPACAIPCLTSAISVAGCAPTDEVCQCGTGLAAIQTAITPCLLTACNAVDIGIAASVGFALCSSFSAGISATTTPSSAATTSPSTTAPLTSSSGSASGSGSSSSAQKTTTVTASTITGPATTNKPASSTTAAPNTTVTTSKPPAISSAGAQALVVGLGSVAGLVAGLMAAL